MISSACLGGLVLSGVAEQLLAWVQIHLLGIYRPEFVQ